MEATTTPKERTMQTDEFTPGTAIIVTAARYPQLNGMFGVVCEKVTEYERRANDQEDGYLVSVEPLGARVHLTAREMRTADED